MDTNQSDIVVIGAGMAGLSAAALLAAEGRKVTVLEANWLPGGCASSYPRKGRIFEAGATTLVGLGGGLPLQFVLDRLGLSLPAIHLDTPMRIHLKNGQTLTRFEDLDRWIAEAERVFGPAGQRAFWKECFGIARFVWETSLVQRAFPPRTIGDLWFAARNFRPRQIAFAALAFRSTRSLLRQHGLDQNPDFVDFVNEQLLITAQNHLDEVNVLFGATALCYTNFPNYYLPGGLIQLAEPLAQAIRDRGGDVLLRHRVQAVTQHAAGYEVASDKGTWQCRQVVFAVPANNTAELFAAALPGRRLKHKTMPSAKLRSAFQMGIVVKGPHPDTCIHHQIHLKEKLPVIGSDSIFLSMSHPADASRAEPGEWVASVSTHIFDPEKTIIEDKSVVEQAILKVLADEGFIQPDQIVFFHSSTPKSWQKWTGRKWGFVGGYPQYMRIRPWEMLEARLDRNGAYQCGDSTYPGQGIPGACLSGIVAWQKMKLDGRI